jgi:hypothetical protein
LPFRLDRANGRYLRVEVFDAAGVPLGFSNPMWLLPDTDEVEVPKARRFHPRAVNGPGEAPL